MVRRGGSAPPSPQCRCDDLLLIYRRVWPCVLRGDESGSPGWIRAINLPIQSRALFKIELQG